MMMPTWLLQERNQQRIMILAILLGCRNKPCKCTEASKFEAAKTQKGTLRDDSMRVSMAMEVSKIVGLLENPIYKWMMTGGSPMTKRRPPYTMDNSWALKEWEVPARPAGSGSTHLWSSILTYNYAHIMLHVCCILPNPNLVNIRRSPW